MKIYWGSWAPGTTVALTVESEAVSAITPVGKILGPDGSTIVTVWPTVKRQAMGFEIPS